MDCSAGIGSVDGGASGGTGVERRNRTGRGAAVSEGGFSLLEILITVAIFGIAMAGLTSSQLAAIALSRTNREVSAATDAAQGVLEALRDEDDFASVFSRWNGTTGDDPGVGASPGNAFDVRGLEPLANDPDGRVGEVVFPGDGIALLEDGNDRLLGMPRDLNRDEGVDGVDHKGDYHILPVLVRVRWRGPGGAQQVLLVGTLAER
jgi:prepilin-type N-terminal cleavage/methylation domain-containing protein